MKYIFVILIIAFTGCATKYDVQTARLADLTTLLLGLGPNIQKQEAQLLANSMLQYAAQLAKDYELVKPPLYHNFLVNIGLKKRGLCWHFASDMLTHALSLGLKFDYYIGGANIAAYWQEHNSLVVTCRGCAFADGIVLDPWRDSGKLFFAKVKNDPDYEWSQRGKIRR